jgi:hypothetical protein
MSTPCEQAPSVVENSWKLPNMNHIDLTWFDSTCIVDGLSLSIFIYLYIYIYIIRIPTLQSNIHVQSPFSFRARQQPRDGERFGMPGTFSKMPAQNLWII